MQNKDDDDDDNDEVCCAYNVFTMKYTSLHSDRYDYNFIIYLFNTCINWHVLITLGKGTP